MPLCGGCFQELDLKDEHVYKGISYHAKCCPECLAEKKEVEQWKKDMGLT